MSFSPLVDQCIQALRCLPGVGPKSAQRMAFKLLSSDRREGYQLVAALTQALEKVDYCQRCRTFSETTLCHFCQQSQRDPSLLCIVETPADVLAVEQTSSFRGFYFVLRGRLSPLDGIGPRDIGIDQLLERLAEPELQEVILATNPTVEGEATAHYIAELVKQNQKRATRIAYGVPLGGELEYIDGGTLAQAFAGRGTIL
jgi:recombination protein RecR